MDYLDDATALERRIVEKANESLTPITANFELTPDCTLSCDMCFIHTKPSAIEKAGGVLPLQTWLRYAEELRDMGTLFILLTGGEPMLYPGFSELYTKLRQMGFILTINTNGTLIDENIIATLKRYKPRRVNVTLYGGNSDTYGRLCHNRQGFDRSMNALHLLKSAGIDTKLNVSIVKKNIDDYDQIIAIAKELDIPAEVNAYMFPLVRRDCGVKRNIPQERLDAESAADIDMRYMQYKRGDEYPMFIKEMRFAIDNIIPQEGCSLSCRAAKSSCWISWRGIMTPCVLMESPAVSLHEKTVHEAWAEVTEAAGKLVPHPECKGCKLRPLCDVCYAAVSNEKEVVGDIRYICRMTEAKEKIVRAYNSNKE